MRQQLKTLLILIGMTAFLIGLALFFSGEKELSRDKFVSNEKTTYKLEQIIEGKDDLAMLNPLDVAIAEDGSIFVADSEKNRIQVFDRNGKYLFQFGGVSEKEQDPDYYLDYPVSIALDQDQNAYIVDLLNQRIAIFDQEGQFLENFTTRDRGLISPTTVTIVDNYLYTFDKFDHQIKKYTLDGDLLLTIGTQGNGDGQFMYPFNIAVSTSGNIKVSDTGNGRIQVFDDNGVFEYTFKGSFSMPSGIAVDKENIYITDPVDNKVVVTDHLGIEKEQIKYINGETGTHFYYPEGIEVTNTHLYIVDKGNNRIVVYKLE